MKIPSFFNTQYNLMNNHKSNNIKILNLKKNVSAKYKVPQNKISQLFFEASVISKSDD